MSCDTNYLPARWNLPSAVAGDTFPGTGAITILVNGEAPPSALESVAMTFSGTAPLVLSSANGGLVVDDAAAWTFHIPESEIPLSPGVHTYELQTTSAAGQLRTYLQGSWKLI
jgi:hypothetical protein